ncbi:DUF58 domain-containing protein [Oceanobacillus rekensis]|uniref:DUF58 domain-containing protein n=1 Tax=Oceanobacillus rekensis TaxID=937927 RepID=UPI000B4498E5|nr:DUF58 domain-containing protein [Oceanobacillus rekensis]
MKDALRIVGNILFVCALFTILFSYAMFQGGFVSWFLFFSFLPIFLYLIGFLIYPIKRWKVSRRFSHHIIEAGDSINATIEVKRSFPFPLYYCIIEEVIPQSLMKVDNRNDKYQYMHHPDKIYVERSIKRVTFPIFKRGFQLPYSITNVPRGEHRLKKIRIRTSDIFGFVKKEHVFAVSDEIIAYPSSHALKMSERFSKYEQGSVSSTGHHLTNTNVAVGVREYAPGDRFSWIDWKQTARKNSVMTKEFEQEKSTDILLIHDSCQIEGLNPLAFEATIEICLSLMETFQNQDSKVGLLSIGKKTVYFPSDQSKANKLPVNHYLTRLTPGGERTFSMNLKEEIKRIDKGDFVIIITTHLDDFLKQTIRRFTLRTKQASVICIQSEALISDEEQQLIQQLRYSNIPVQLLTEKELMKAPIEVSIG